MTGPTLLGLRLSAIRPVLFALVLVVTVLGGLGAIWLTMEQSRIHLDDRLRDAARDTSFNLDTQLSNYRAAAISLAASPRFQMDPSAMGSLHDHAQAISRALGGWVAATDANDPAVRLFDTRGEPAPGGSRPDCGASDQPLRAAYQVVHDTLQPVISGLFVDARDCRPSAAVVAPVVKDGQLIKMVLFGIPLDQLSELLRERGTPEFIAGIHDERGMILARSAQADQMVGRTAPSFSIRATTPGGMAIGKTAEGLPWQFTTRPLRTAPSWTVVVGVPLGRIALLTHGSLRWTIFGFIIILACMVLAEAILWLSRQSDTATRKTLDQLLEGVPAILYVNEVEPNGRFSRRFLSRSAARVTGWPWKTLSAPGALADLTLQEFVAPRAALFQKALAEGTATLDYQIRHGDGTNHWMRSVARALPREGNGPALVVGFLTDVTAEYQVKDHMRQVQKFAVLGEMSSRIGHEISQPLAAISMAAENGAMTLERATPNIESAHEKFLRISAQIDRVTQLVKHISTFSRKIKEEDIGPVDPRAIVDGALTVSGPRCQGEAVTIETNLPANPPKVRGVGLLLEQVVVNLIANACDAYQERPEQTDKRIIIDTSREGGKLVLSVEDRAGGIPAHVIDRVFEPFVTTKPPGKGTGLGLAISLATITRFGGTVVVFNRDGGARFEISLPIMESAPPVPGDAAARPPVTA